MAEPYDGSVNLSDVDELIQTQYLPRYYETAGGRFGRTFNRIFQIAEKAASGDGFTMQAELGPGDFARASNNPLASITGSTSLQAVKLRLRYDTNNLAANDFTQVTASCQTDVWQLKNGGDGAIVDLAERNAKSVIASYDEHIAYLRNVGRNAVAALVNGTPKLNNGVTYAGATGTATNAGGARVKVDSGIFAVLKTNSWIDFIRPATGATVAGSVWITDKNPGDLSIGVSFATTQFGGRVSSGNLALVADNDYIAFSGEYNSGLYSVGAWMSEATAGESFLGGVDRTTASYRWMLPINPRYGATTTTITKSFFDDVAIAMGYFAENMDGAGLIAQSDLTVNNKLRNELGEESFKPIPQSDERMKKFYQFGSTGLAFEHPSLGVIKILGDALCPSTTVRFIDPSTWMSVHYAVRGLTPMPGGEGMGSWYRVTDSTPNTGKSLIVKSDWAALQQDFCTMPQKNAQISNIQV